MKYRFQPPTLVSLVFLLYWTLANIDQVEPSSRAPMVSTVRNFLDLSGVPLQDECDQDIKEIQYYLQQGVNLIEKTNETDVIVVIGLSGHGKSTLVQFVANNSNTLRAVCEDEECAVIDESGSIGGDPVSATFIPNLVLEDNTNTAYYDMPGFNDNRNQTIEIANSIFIQQIIYNATRMKIVIAHRQASLTAGDRLLFVTAIQNLVKLIRAPEKFQKGMALIGTVADYHKQDQSIKNLFVKFVESIKENAEELFKDEAATALTILEILGQTEIKDNITTPLNFGYFPEAMNGGLLLEDPKFVESKKNISSLIMDRLEFASIENSDFGLPMSDAALRLLEKTAVCISRSIAEAMSSFSVSLSSHIVTKMEDISGASDDDVKIISSLVTSVTTADYTFADVPNSEVEYYLLGLRNIISSFGLQMADPTLEQLDGYSTMFDFITPTGALINVDPKSWVQPLKDLLPNVAADLQDVATSAQLSAIAQIKQISSNISEQILSNLGSLPSSAEKIKELDELVKQLETLEALIEQRTANSNNMTDFLLSYENDLSNLVCSNSCIKIDQKRTLAVFDLFSETSEFKWRNNDWKSPVKDIILLGARTELDVLQFFDLLMMDLSTYQIQSNREGDLVSWWLGVIEINEGVLSDLWKKLNQTGLTATKQYSKEYMSSIFLSSEVHASTFKSLLDVYLGQVSCSEGTDVNAVVVGNFLSLKDALVCLPKMDTRKSITFIGMDTLYIDDSIIGLQYTTNLEITLIAPTIFSEAAAVIDLTGSKGSDKNNSGASGEPGNPAGNFYFAYENFDTRSSSKSANVKLDGGKGGKGGEGSVGGIGKTGGRRPFSVSSDCFAWGGGEYDNIQIRVYPNSCNSEFGGRCHAGDNGIEVTIEGTPGEQGQPGGKGGDGGAGGAAGCKLIHELSDNSKRNEPECGGQGASGDVGDGGAGGPGGRYGDDYLVTVDDTCCRGFIEYYCKELRSRYVESDKFLNLPGPVGPKGNPSNLVVSPQQPNTETLKSNILHYIEQATEMSDNQFIGKKVSNFVKKLKEI